MSKFTRATEMSQFKSPDDTIVSQSGEVKESLCSVCNEPNINREGNWIIHDCLTRLRNTIDKLRADAERFESKYVKACSELADVEADLATCVSALKKARQTFSGGICTRGEYVRQLDGTTKYEFLKTPWGEMLEEIDDVVAKVGNRE